MAIKRSRKQEPNATPTMADRLSTLPEELQIRILSSLDTKHAFETSLLSKAWSSKWTHVPSLDFNSHSFKKLKVFDKFVYGALSVPRSAKVKKLTFKRDRICSAKILKKVFDYTFKQRVEELDVSINKARKESGWPIMSHPSCDSLKSLKLQSYKLYIRCSYLGLRSGPFKNLASLHLRKAIITDLDPFSGFTALKKLTLVWCFVLTDEKTLNIHAPHLSELTLSYCVNQFTAVGDTRSSVLDTVDIRLEGCYRADQVRIMFEDLMMIFNALCNAKSVTVYPSVIHLLSLFPDELADRCSPFQELKSLKVDFSSFSMQSL
ncbi:F-box/FBD/LRR-repeat protein At5g22700-like [Bidens hawaiensis]|uniref:F-box/FBD/LRR-repeat protein At5g22700-like n=1 Tax=Bidens hawaiensis TaxID=980011 RepID=UPI00404AC787